VLGLSAGSALVRLALVRAGILRPWFGAAVLLAVWTVALVVVVRQGELVRGAEHGRLPAPLYASLAAFASLPAAAPALGRRWRRLR
jgi:hypothetical protein